MDITPPIQVAAAESSRDHLQRNCEMGWKEWAQSAINNYDKPRLSCNIALNFLPIY
jgi:hypothetical protein